MMVYDVKFNMNAQTWLLNHYWLFLLEYFFPSQGGPWAKRLCRPYAYGVCCIYEGFMNTGNFLSQKNLFLVLSCQHSNRQLFGL